MILEETLEKNQETITGSDGAVQAALGFDRKAAAQSWQTGGCSGANRRDDRK